jgi:hypothetical protein
MTSRHEYFSTTSADVRRRECDYVLQGETSRLLWSVSTYWPLAKGTCPLRGRGGLLGMGEGCTADGEG